MSIRTKEPNHLESVFQPVLNALGHLSRLVNLGRADDGDFERVIFLLETLPLASDEFGVARLRLSNARRYRIVNETGAAAWEVRTVMLQLGAKATARSFEPRRRFVQP